MLNNKKKFFFKKKVLITGHTGFKGSWLSLWMHLMGAKVLGISKDIPTSPSHFKLANLNKLVKSNFIDIENLEKIKKIIKDFKPDYIFHLAAQAIVKKSYSNSITTWKSNLIGTINILESLKEIKKKTIVVLITSDKVYKNIETKKGYKENDILGGVDPYGASKSATEIAINSYIKSFFSSKKNKIFISTARAGNVIGGGDWAKDRLIPDCINAFSRNKPIKIRNPNFTRPWQHVLEPLSGYLSLAEKLHREKKKPRFSSWNFGPNKTQHAQVKKLIDLLSNFWVGDTKVFKSIKSNSKLYETRDLYLDSFKAKRNLNWKTKWDLRKSVQMTTEWYLAEKNGLNMYEFSLKQLKDYEKEK